MWSLTNDDKTLRVREEGPTDNTDAPIKKSDNNRFEYREQPDSGQKVNMILLSR